MDMLTDALINDGILTTSQATTLAEKAKTSNMELADFLYHHTDYDSNRIAEACANYFGYPKITLADIQEPQQMGAIIHAKMKGAAIVAIYNPSDIITIAHAQTPYIISAHDYFTIRKTEPTKTRHEQLDKTIIEQLDKIIADGITKHASDIHFEPTDDDVAIRLRIQGLLTPYRNIHHATMIRLITRLKVLSNADITQTRLPQDGRFTFTHKHHHCDCRINFCPTIRGEKVVIRLLDVNQHLLQLNELGLIDNQKELLLTHLNKAQGLILVTGPTGSGKTQTLYTAINYLNRSTTNISTIEDPVEIKLHGINQIAVDESLGLSFSTALRALLRQDPDIIMVGEIRDQETAALAIRAAQTGHLVLATLHTQDAIEAISRLENLGISRFNIAATLKLVIAQRLIRQLTNGALKKRAGIFELLPVTPLIQHHITSPTTSLALRNIALDEGFHPLTMIGKIKITRGLTTQEELHRVGIY